MSAIAFINTSENIILLSDGVTFSREGTRQREDIKKISLLNDRVALLSIGNGIQVAKYLTSLMREKKISEPDEVAQNISLNLKKTFQGWDKSTEDREYLIYVIGFDKEGDSCLYQFFSGAEDPFKPEPIELKNGQIECIAHTFNAKQTNFKNLFAQYAEMYEDNQHAARTAFEKMIRKYEDKGLLVGGKIFTETLRPNF